MSPLGETVQDINDSLRLSSPEIAPIAEPLGRLLDSLEEALCARHPRPISALLDPLRAASTSDVTAHVLLVSVDHLRQSLHLHLAANWRERAALPDSDDIF